MKQKDNEEEELPGEDSPDDLEQEQKSEELIGTATTLPTIRLLVKRSSGSVFDLIASGKDMNEAASLFDHGLNRYKNLRNDNDSHGKQSKKGETYIG